METPSASPFLHEYTVDAAEHNAELLKSFDYDLEQVIDAHPGTTSSYGSELRPIEQLQPLLRHHPYWNFFEENHTQGIDYKFTRDITEEERLKLLKTNIERGNHAAAVEDENRDHVSKAIKMDVQLGYGFPLTIDGVLKLKDAEVYPLGLQSQWTIDEEGTTIPKKRITHDLSNNPKEEESVNQRVDLEGLPDSRYGFAMLRFLHLVHHIRWRNPDERILCNKIDVEKAYRRLHTRARITAKCIAVWFLDTMWKGTQPPDHYVTVVLGRLPFGSSPAPSNFSITSEPVFDLAADLLACKL